MNNKANVFETYIKYVSLIQNLSKPLKRSDDSALATQVYQNNSPMWFFICGKV